MFATTLAIQNSAQAVSLTALPPAPVEQPPTAPAPIETRIVDETTLHLNGTGGIYYRIIFRVYELKLFVKESSSDADAVMNSPDLKLVRMTFLRDLKAEDVRDGLRQSYNDNCLDQCEALKPHLQSFLNVISDMPTDSFVEFTFYPDKLRIFVPGRDALDIPSKAFGDIMLRSWLGPNPPSTSIKRGLLAPPK